MSQDLVTAVVTPTFRISYPNIFKPAFNKLSQKNEYSLEALFKKGENLDVIKKACENALVKKFGPDKSKWPKGLKNPFRDQAEKAKEGKLPDGCEAGAIFLRLKSEKKPGVVDQNTQPILEDQKIYAGCYVRAHINAFAYQKGANVGVSLSLNHVQLVADGEPFSGRPQAETAFTPVSSESKATDASDIFA